MISTPPECAGVCVCVLMEESSLSFYGDAMATQREAVSL